MNQDKKTEKIEMLQSHEALLQKRREQARARRNIETSEQRRQQRGDLVEQRRQYLHNHGSSSSPTGLGTGGTHSFSPLRGKPPTPTLHRMQRNMAYYQPTFDRAELYVYSMQARQKGFL